MNSARDRTARNLLNQKLTSLILKLAEAIQQLEEYPTLKSEVKALEKVKTQLEKIGDESRLDPGDAEVTSVIQDSHLRNATVGGNLTVSASRFLIDGIPIQEYINLRVAKELDERGE